MDKTPAINGKGDGAVPTAFTAAESGRATPRTPPTARTCSSVIAGSPVTYTLRVSARARSLRLVIRPASGLEVVVPRGTSAHEIERVLRDKARWIMQTLERVARESTAVAPALADGSILTFAGCPLRLALQTGAPAGRFHAAISGETLQLTVARDTQEEVRAALEAWYRRQAARVFAERLAVCNAAYGFSYGRVSIREQKSRWGSCSRKGNLNFNWRLLLAPLPVLDYVVTHELAHLKEPNHSPRFWALVASACPEYQTQRRWLRQHGRELRF
jgi:predicted metal-dependent hydrolase